MRTAASNGKIEVVKWLCEHGSVGSEEVNAAQWMLSRGFCSAAMCQRPRVIFYN